MIRSGYGCYALGYRFCSRCRTYFKTRAIRCPDCGTLLRKKPRRKRNRLETSTRPHPVISKAEAG
ncbi:MAG: hypothetical protein QXS96_05115 [Candidatus Caldarchaeum sp.]|uniref:Uncharacterized protein n=1 Tax=Caldiarchaeum subterraneum TaxID=311458 RepID=A0A7J3G4Y5_CALS0